MQSTSFWLDTSDGVSLFVYRWVPEGPPKAVVQIVHGWAEHAARYARLAEALCREGFAVYTEDHRGHGRTARTPAELGYFADRDGWNRVVEDLWQLHQRLQSDHPQTPLVIFGHSLGAFLVQQFISEHGDSIVAAVLSGTNGKPPAVARLGRLIALFERLRHGRHGKSRLLQSIFFGPFNKRFEPARTPFDWLSRDTAEVDKYVADPLCGFDSRVQLFADILGGLLEISKPARLAQDSENASDLHLPRQQGPGRQQHRPIAHGLPRGGPWGRHVQGVSRRAPRDSERNQPRRGHQGFDRLAQRRDLSGPQDRTSERAPMVCRAEGLTPSV